MTATAWQPGREAGMRHGTELLGRLEGGESRNDDQQRLWLVAQLRQCRRRDDLRGGRRGLHPLDDVVGECLLLVGRPDQGGERPERAAARPRCGRRAPGLARDPGRAAAGCTGHSPGARGHRACRRRRVRPGAPGVPAPCAFGAAGAVLAAAATSTHDRRVARRRRRLPALGDDRDALSARGQRHGGVLARSRAHLPDDRVVGEDRMIVLGVVGPRDEVAGRGLRHLHGGGWGERAVE